MPQPTFLCGSCDTWRPAQRHHEESGATIPLLSEWDLEVLQREGLAPPPDYAPLPRCSVGHELCDACADHPCAHPSCRYYRAAAAQRRIALERGAVL